MQRIVRCGIELIELPQLSIHKCDAAIDRAVGALLKLLRIQTQYFVVEFFLPIGLAIAIRRQRINAERAPEAQQVAAAKPFVVQSALRASPQFLSALDCLTQAVYYEAGFESEAGKRAVAQVVLNRVRHPAFPKSVCGVVYQGSERTTGCQFSFTCDGSLARIPARTAWGSARQVAQSALSGWVERSVGTATHYHANYVVPYWASSLDKIVQIGRVRQQRLEIARRAVEDDA